MGLHFRFEVEHFCITELSLNTICCSYFGSHTECHFYEPNLIKFPLRFNLSTKKNINKNKLKKIRVTLLLEMTSF